VLLQFVYARAECYWAMLVEQPEGNNPLWRTNLDVTTNTKYPVWRCLEHSFRRMCGTGVGCWMWTDVDV